MHSILWASIISAGVALVTTLLVEYPAKPWLEVRKDRILEDNRNQRTRLRGLDHATTLAGSMLALRKEQTNVMFREQTIKFASEVQELASLAYEELAVPKYFGDDWTEITAITHSFCLRAKIVVPDEQSWNKFDAATDQLDRYTKVLRISRWHFWRQRKLRHEIISHQYMVRVAGHQE